MNKLTLVLCVIMNLMACRKDAKLDIIHPTNPCSDSSAVFCLYPNPVEDTLNLFLNMPQHANAKIICYDRYGIELLTVADSGLVKGGHSFIINTSNFPIGLNVCSIEILGQDYFSPFHKF